MSADAGGAAEGHGRMRALEIERVQRVGPGVDPLVLRERPVPRPGHGEVLVAVSACGVCHTELDEIEGRTPPPRLPMVPGHQVVGRVVDEGGGCSLGLRGRRVGVAWIHSACGACRWCREGRENLCPDFSACGRDAPGGYAEYMTIGEAFAHPLPAGLDDAEATPLLCAGAVGFRSLRLCDLHDGQALGLTGFGSSGHLVLQMARHRYPASPVYVFARSERQRAFATELGAAWTGDTEDTPPTAPAALIDTTPAWRPVLAALAALAPGGTLVINAIRKEDGDAGLLSGLDYDRHLWREKRLRTVANVTRADVRETLQMAVDIPLHPRIERFALDEANRALRELKEGHLRGAKVLVVRRDG